MAYEITPEMQKRLENDFTYHAPHGDQPKRYEEMRSMAYVLAAHIVTNTPPSREQSLALTKLEEVVFWANASIARNEGEDNVEEIRFDNASVVRGKRTGNG